MFCGNVQLQISHKCRFHQACVLIVCLLATERLPGTTADRGWSDLGADAETLDQEVGAPPDWKTDTQEDHLGALDQNDEENPLGQKAARNASVINPFFRNQNGLYCPEKGECAVGSGRSCERVNGQGLPCEFKISPSGEQKCLPARLAPVELPDSDWCCFQNEYGDTSCPPATLRLPNEGDVLHVLATAKNTSVGFEVSNLPTQQNPRVFIDHAVEDGWAEKYGVSSGDEISKIDGKRVGSLDAQAFSRLLRKRPLQLELLKKAYWKAGEKAKLIGLGWHLEHNEGKSVTLLNHAGHAWEVQLENGEVLRLPVANLAPVDSEDLREKYGIAAVGTDGNLNRLHELMKENVKGDHQAVIFAATMQEPGDAGIDFASTPWSQPPSSGGIVVGTVEPDSWAAKMGIRSGAKIVDIGFRAPETFESEAAFKELWDKRPLPLMIQQTGSRAQITAGSKAAVAGSLAKEKANLEKKRTNGIPLSELPQAPTNVLVKVPKNMPKSRQIEFWSGGKMYHVVVPPGIPPGSNIDVQGIGGSGDAPRPPLLSLDDALADLKRNGRQQSEDDTKWRQQFGYSPPGAEVNMKKLLEDVNLADEDIKKFKLKGLPAKVEVGKDDQATAHKVITAIEALGKVVHKGVGKANTKDKAALQEIEKTLNSLEVIFFAEKAAAKHLTADNAAAKQLADSQSSARYAGFLIGNYNKELNKAGDHETGEVYFTQPLKNPGAKKNLALLRFSVKSYLLEASYIKTDWDYTVDPPELKKDTGFAALKQLLNVVKPDIAAIGRRPKVGTWTTKYTRQTEYARTWIEKLPLLMNLIDEDERANKMFDDEEAGLNGGSGTEAGIQEENDQDLAIDQEQLAQLMEVQRLLLAERSFINGKSQSYSLDVGGELRQKYNLGPLGSDGNLQTLLDVEKSMMQGNAPDEAGVDLQDEDADLTGQDSVVVDSDFQMKQHGRELSKDNTAWRQGLGYRPPGAEVNVEKLLLSLEEVDEEILDLQLKGYKSVSEHVTNLRASEVDEAALPKIISAIDELTEVVKKGHAKGIKTFGPCLTASCTQMKKTNAALKDLEQRLGDMNKIAQEDSNALAQSAASSLPPDPKSQKPQEMNDRTKGVALKMEKRAQKANMWFIQKQQANTQMHIDIRKLLAEEHAYLRHMAGKTVGHRAPQKPGEAPEGGRDDGNSEGGLVGGGRDDGNSEAGAPVPSGQEKKKGARELPEYFVVEGRDNVRQKVLVEDADVEPKPNFLLGRMDGENASSESVESTNNTDSESEKTEIIPGIVYKPASPYLGNGNPLSYSGLKDCGEHFKKAMGEASVAVGVATAAAAATVDHTQQLLLHHRGLRDNLRGYQTVERMFKENLRQKHAHLVLKARRLLARGQPVAVLEQAHQKSELAKLALQSAKLEAQAKLEAAAEAAKKKAAAISPTHSHAKEWTQLTDDEKQLWGLLGWTQAAWDRDVLVPDSARRKWKDLPSKQKDAATRLGYSADNWDSFKNAPGAHIGLRKPGSSSRATPVLAQPGSEGEDVEVEVVPQRLVAPDGQDRVAPDGQDRVAPDGQDRDNDIGSDDWQSDPASGVEDQEQGPPAPAPEAASDGWIDTSAPLADHDSYGSDAFIEVEMKSGPMMQKLANATRK